MGDSANQNKSNQGSTSFVSITYEGNYFNTREQIARRNIQYFTDFGEPQIISGSHVSTDFFSRHRTEKDDVIYNSSIYATGSTAIDPSGSPRKYLASNIDYYASSSIDAYKNGVEISRTEHWVAGIAKISAGTPGHLLEKNRFGISKVSITDPDIFYEIDLFDPIQFVESGGDIEKYTYPFIITADFNQAENVVLDGIIEPHPIRPVISNFSINFPFEPHGFRASLSDGNNHPALSVDRILSVDYYEPERINKRIFLDAVDYVSMTNEETGKPVEIGSPIGFFSLEMNYLNPFKDEVLPRDTKRSDSYDDELWNVLLDSFMSGSTTYIEQGKRTGTTGFIYSNSPTGTDSIAYGGLLY